MKNFSEFLIFHKRHAFSLVEMLMALLVASLLLAALAPVMTRKLGENINISGTGGVINPPAGSYCWSTSSGGGSSTMEFDENGNRKVKYTTEPGVYYVNFALASGGGGGAGASLPKSEDQSIESNNTNNSGYTSLKIEPYMDDFDVVSIIGGGGGGGGGAGLNASVTCTGSVSANKCACMGYQYDSVNKVCVSNNQGSKNLTNAKSACSNLTPSSKWQLPTMAQLGNWSNQYSKFGITSGTTVWSSSTSACSKTEAGTCWCRDTMETSTCSGNYYYYKCCGGVQPTLEACNSACNYQLAHGHYICRSCYTVSCDKTVSCGTNYHYYQLSGSSWSAITNVTTNTNSRLTYCVYNGADDVTSTGFYSLSGGGGGGAPAIQNNNFNSNILSVFRQRIKENVGGYIVLEVGTGGAGGAKSTAKGQKPADGYAGNGSCIAIKGIDNQIKYRLCSPGGKAGVSGNATVSNAHINGWGSAGEATAVSNACFAIDYTTNTSGIKTTFDCSLAGKAGSNGGASSSNPTAGGKGAAGVLNSVQAGGTKVVNGVDASSSNYGAGGGGGSASNETTYGAGGKGAGGYIKLNYKVKYDAAGGGGGGAGNLAIIKEYRVNQAECTFIIGKGGSGGNVSANGKEGGDTSVTCTTAGGEMFKVYGGQGGKTGTTANALGSHSIGGDGGIHTVNTNSNAYSEDIISMAPSKKVVKTGLDGIAGGLNDSAYTNYKPGEFSAGGRGGTSGAGKKGACGAMLNDVVCTYSHDITPNASSITGKSMAVGDVKFIDLEVAESYGESSSGGGGGAWQIQAGSGTGGDGLGGYACIWWEKAE